MLYNKSVAKKVIQFATGRYPMDQLESQIAKIYLQSTKAAQNFVFVMAEKAAASEAEIFMVAELPILNPNAKQQCEQICLATAAALKRTYKRPLTENSFENAIAQINEELGKLAEMGQNYWINKFNCVIGVKNQNEFTVSSTGKVSAFLLRDKQFSDINTSSALSHPLKTFDSFATGKIKLNDILILSNTQLLNYVSMDRLADIFSKQDFLQASQTIIELLKENAGPEVEFGTVFNKQVPLGQTASETVNLESYVVSRPKLGNLPNALIGLVKNLFGLEGPKRQRQTELPKISVSQRFGQIKGASSRFLSSAKGAYGDFSGKLKTVSQAISPGQIKEYSPVKKYLFISIAVCVLAAGLSIAAAIHNKNKNAQLAKVAAQLKTSADNLNLAQSSLLYKDDQKALEYFSAAQKAMPQKSSIDKSQTAQYDNLQKQLENFKKQSDRSTPVDAKSLGNLSDAQRLLNLGNFLATANGKTVVSYEKTSGKIEDGRLKTSQDILQATSFKTGQAVTYNGESLSIWNYELGTNGAPVISSVPAKDNFAGMAYYPTNNRMYVIDKSKAQAVSFLINKDSLQKPTNSLSASDLNFAQDIAIDGNIYILKQDSIVKYSAGKSQAFNMPFMFEPFSGPGKLYTKIGWQYLYLLDISKNRIIIMDKKGNLYKILTSPSFTKISDFAVDEEQRMIFILNGSELLRVDF